MIVLSLEEFVAKRRTDQQRLEERLLPLVRDALNQMPFDFDALVEAVRQAYLSIFHSEGGPEDSKRLAGFLRDVTSTLAKTRSPTSVTEATIATWLATATLNAATLDASDFDPEPLAMEWVTMHDNKVRLTHRDADGQRQLVGEPFIVGGEKMRFPGDPRVRLDLWVNCRCSLAPTLAVSESSIAAAVEVTDRHQSGRCIVALPADDQMCHSLGSEPTKHMTLIWLGTPDENPDLDMATVHQQVESAAGDLVPFSADVKTIDSLGDDGALVWMMEPDAGTDVRDRLFSEAHIKGGHEAVKQHPSFTPHVTIGYDEPVSGDAIDSLTSVDRITFDRIGVWEGDDKQEYPLGGKAMTDTVTEAPPQDADEMMQLGPVAWHGVLAPEGVWSGDGRRFAENSLRYRDLPIPLTWQKASGDGHAGSVVVAKIEQIARVGNEMRASGTFMLTPEADEAVGLLIEFGRFGVSVDADDAEFDHDPATDKVTFTSARIASASMVAIPAFAEAFIALGEWADGEMPMPDDGTEMMPCDPEDPDCVDGSKPVPTASDEEVHLGVGSLLVYVSEKAWDGSAARFTPEQWKASCVLHVCDGLEKSCHKLPIKEPGGQLSRAGVHAAAARFNQVQAPPAAKAAAKRALRGAYSTLGETPPDVLANALSPTIEAGRGPGWITDPVATKRIHDYWTVPGNEGYAKIGWGVPGDFERCRTEIGQEIAEEDPATVAKYMNQICAQWHKDATGFWPGHAPAEVGHGLESIALSDTDQVPAPALTLVSSGGLCAPSEWFKNPEFDRATPFTITEEGRVFGHIAQWTSCHIGYPGVCVAPPRSASGYAYFLTGEVLTDAGPVPTGPITLGGGHAPRGLSARAATAHYDNTTTAVCDVTCGDDEFGIWVAGWVRPGATEEQVVAMRASAPSGDWRELAGELEMIAALSVNTPGFVTPRVGIRNGVQVSLVAAGMVTAPQSDPVSQLVDDVIAVIGTRRAQMATLAERVKAREKMAALAARVRGGE